MGLLFPNPLSSLLHSVLLGDPFSKPSSFSSFRPPPPPPPSSPEEEAPAGSEEPRLRPTYTRRSSSEGEWPEAEEGGRNEKKGVMKNVCFPLPSFHSPFQRSPCAQKKKHREEKRARRNAAKLLWLEWKTREGEKLIPFRHPCNIFPFLPIQTCYGEAEAALQLFDKCAQILAGSTVSIFQPVVFSSSLHPPLPPFRGRRGEGGERASLTMGKGKKNGRKGEEKRDPPPLRIGRERKKTVCAAAAAAAVVCTSEEVRSLSPPPFFCRFRLGSRPIMFRAFAG